MTREETLALAARHVASGKKMIMPFRRPWPVGGLTRRWIAGIDKAKDEVVTDQPLVVIRESTFEEYLENLPAEGPLGGKPRPGTRFYEVTCG